MIKDKAKNRQGAFMRKMAAILLLTGMVAQTAAMPVLAGDGTGIVTEGSAAECVTDAEASISPAGDSEAETEGPETEIVPVSETEAGIAVSEETGDVTGHGTDRSEPAEEPESDPDENTAIDHADIITPEDDTLRDITVIETYTEDETAEIAAQDMEICVNAPANIRCGVDTTFTLTVSEGADADSDISYKYMFQTVYYGAVSEGHYLMDPSRQKYQDSNTFTFKFTASGTYMLCFYVMNMSTFAYQRRYAQVTVSDAAYPSLDTVVSNVAAQCLAAGCKTDYEKALWMHDWLLNHCVYDISLNYCSDEGALTRGSGTCEAYTAAYTRLLAAVGIDAARVTGNGHCWNVVKMDGSWYQTDVTWDDNGYSSIDSYESHMYFGLTDTLMQAVHSEHTAQTNRPCGTLADNYFIQSGEISDWDSEFISPIQQAMDAGKESLTVTVSRTGLPDVYKTVMYGIAAYDLMSKFWTGGGTTMTLSASYADNAMSFTWKEGSRDTGSESGNTGTDAAGEDEDTADVSDFVTRLYEVCLDRKPDAKGLAGWCAQLRAGTKTGTQVAYGFIFSS